MIRMFMEPEGEPQELTERLQSDQKSVQQVSRALDRVSDQLRSLIPTGMPALVNHVSQQDRLEQQVLDLQSCISTLVSKLETVREKVTEPHSRISQRILLLNRLKTTVDLMRKISRLQGCARRVLSQRTFDTKSSHGIRELGKSAQALREFDLVLHSDPQLDQVHEVQRLVTAVSGMRGTIMDKCDAVFDQGIDCPDILILAKAAAAAST